MPDAEDPTLEFMGYELGLLGICQGHSDREEKASNIRNYLAFVLMK